jgi:cation transport ATPase
MNLLALGIFSRAFFLKPKQPLIKYHDWPYLSFMALSVWISGFNVAWGAILVGSGVLGIGFNGYLDQRWKKSVSVESSIVVSAVLAWSCSVAGLFFSQYFSYGVFFHDGLLAVGAYQVGKYFRDLYKDNLMAEGGSYSHVKQKGVNKDCRDLKEDESFMLEPGQEGYFPFPVKVSCCFKGEMTRDSDEAKLMFDGKKVSIVKPGEAPQILDSDEHRLFPAFTHFIYQMGSLTAKGQFAKSDRINEVPENFLFFVMMVSLAAGVLTAWHSASVLAGFSQFAISIMGACPCVFVFSRPIIGIRAMKWAAEKDMRVNSDEVFKKPVDIVVFDRTHTIYHEGSPGDDYKLSQSGKQLVQGLKERGMRVMVLSGHEGEKAQQRRRNCASELGIPESDILFGCQDKKVQLEHIKRHGVFVGQKPKGSGHCVMYLGDGENDLGALEVADVAVTVGDNHAAQEKSHLRIGASHVSKLLELVDVIKKTGPWMKGLTIAAYAYNLIMLMMVNGLSAYLFAVPMQASVACLAMMTFSMFTLLTASRFKLSSGLLSGNKLRARDKLLKSARFSGRQSILTPGLGPLVSTKDVPELLLNDHNTGCSS